MRDLGRRLAVAVAELSPVKQTVIRHHDVGGWTHGQIALALGISEGMSRRHLSDARAILRRRLGPVVREFLEGGPDDD
jgi:DNA-directed RNA polymerase specialized sigma24 family protein